MTPWEWHPELFAEAARVGITIFSSPFDSEAVQFLDELGAPAFKIASFEIVDHALVAAAAATGKPLIMSTGMATRDEIDEAVAVARAGSDAGLVLLRCNSSYPADPAEMDLLTIPDMRARWKCPIGLSDHTLSSTSAVGAVALGAAVLEKHITLRRSDGGPDAAFSLEPDEFATLVQQVREDATSDGRSAVRTVAARGAVDRISALAVRRRRCRGGRCVDGTPRAFDPSCRRARPEASTRGHRTTSDAAHRAWNAARLVDGGLREQLTGRSAVRPR